MPVHARSTGGAHRRIPGDEQSTSSSRPARNRLVRAASVTLASSALVGGVLAGPAMATSSTTHRPAAATHPTATKVIAHPTLGLRLYNARKKAALAKAKAAKARKLASIRAYEVKQRAAFMSKLLVEASRHRGTPYGYGSVGPSSFDCSGFTRYVFAKMGVALPHSSYGQYAMTTHIPASQVQPGDLLFFDGNGHVGIYAGNGLMWDASRPGGSVELRPPYGPFLVGRVKV